MFIYVVTMFRSNALETHSYVLGVFSKYADAMAAKSNEEDRVQERYIGYIDECLLDVFPPDGVADKLYESSLDRTGLPIDVTVHQ
jgi:hypothetical protein